MYKWFYIAILFNGLIINNYGSHLHECGDHDCAEARASIPIGKGASGKWLDDKTPKRDWQLHEVIDLETADNLCGMCEREYIRFAHIMKHPKYKDRLEVGCICAGYMLGDNNQAKRNISDLMNRVKRRQTFLQKEPEISEKGNPYIKVRATQNNPAHHVVFVKSKYNSYNFIIDGNKNEKWYKSFDEARSAAAYELFPKSL